MDKCVFSLLSESLSVPTLRIPCGLAFCYEFLSGLSYRFFGCWGFVDGEEAGATEPQFIRQLFEETPL